jgi:hypothetical protein
MKTLEECKAAIDEISEICKKHGILLVGTCNNEGIYGEITIEDIDDVFDISVRKADNILRFEYENYVITGINPYFDTAREDNT